MAGEKIVEIMRKQALNAILDTADIVFGQVTSISPLKVKVDSKIILTEEFLLKSSLCYAKTVTVTHYKGVDDTPYEEIVTLWRGLEVGDTVIMIKANKGQLYYIVEREGGLTSV